MNQYRAMKDRHQKEFNAFPIFFAFGDAQFNAAMKAWGLDPNDTDQIYSLGSTGGYYRRSDAPAFHAMTARHDEEFANAISADKTGNGFIYDMFMYELGNHEYSYTGEINATLDALDLTAEDFEKNPALRHGLEKACKKQRALAA